MATTNQRGSVTVLLVMDILQRMMARLPDPSALLANIGNAIAGARAANIPVIHVVLGFRAGYPEVNPANKSFGPIMQSGGFFTPDDEAGGIHPAVAPLPSEIIVVKKRISAFAGNDLDMMLRAMHAEHLVLAGYSTSGIVLSTVREAADKDYRLTVLSDGCDDLNKETHQFLLTDIFPRQAEVVTAAEWVASV